MKKILTLPKNTLMLISCRMYIFHWFIRSPSCRSLREGSGGDTCSSYKGTEIFKVIKPPMSTRTQCTYSRNDH